MMSSMSSYLECVEPSGCSSDFDKLMSLISAHFGWEFSSLRLSVDMIGVLSLPLNERMFSGISG